LVLNMLADGAAVTAENPPWEANEANPPEDGAVIPVLGAGDPNGALALPNPVGCPKDEFEGVADPHGEVLVENPELPNEGVLVAPNAGAPNAGVEFEPAFDELKAGFPKPAALFGVPNGVEGEADVLKVGFPKPVELVADAPVAEAVPHADCRCPMPEGVPNPGTGGLLEGAAKDDLEGWLKDPEVCVGVGEDCGPADTRPG
jgi:hypothetical protein